MTSTPRNDDASDEDLARTVARRDFDRRAMEEARRALEAIYDRHAPTLLAFLSGRARRSDLDDLHQEVWQRVWGRLPSGFDGGCFRGWLFQIARNLLIDEARKTRPESLDVAPTVADGRAGPLEALVASERRTVLENCMKKLDEISARVVRARLAGDGYDEVAHALAISVERAYKLWNKASAKLKTCVKRAG